MLDQDIHHQDMDQGEDGMSPRATVTKAARDRRSEEARQIRHSTQR